MVEKIKELIESSGFNHYGWARLEKPLSMEYYKSWIDRGMHGDMEYLKRHIEIKETPQKSLNTGKTAFVFTRQYLDIPKAAPSPFKNLNVAMYAQGQDYHNWFQQDLDRLCGKFKSQFPNDDFVAFTDSKPVLERDLAFRAGLGWIGKNTCLLNEKRGSLFFIGEIYSSLEIQAKLNTAADRCGTCTRCIDACPTGALVENKVLDATKCISYWTIESKSIPPESLYNNFNTWYFGCDICQSVCPWNQKHFSAEISMKNKNEKSYNKAELTTELRAILQANPDEILEWFKNSPLERARPWAHKRNAMIVAYNLGLTELKEDIGSLANDPKLKELAIYICTKLETRP